MPSQRKPGLTARGKTPLPKCGQPTVAGGICGATIGTPTINGKRYKLKTCHMHASPALRKAMGILPGYRPGCGQKKVPHPMDVMRARIEADVEKYLKPFEDALKAMKAVVVGNGGSAHLEETEDFALRVRAANDILDRVYGRPKQVTEVTGADGAALEVSVPNDEDRRAALAAVLSATGALGTVIPANASASAPSTN